MITRTLIIMFLLTSFQARSSIFTYFSLINQNQNNYQFQIHSIISIGNGTNCPDLYPTPEFVSSDTVYLCHLYDFTGFWQQASCSVWDTVDFLNVYPSANYINVSIGYYTSSLINPGVMDTFWNYHDSTFHINPLDYEYQLMTTKKFDLHPNPTSGQITIFGKLDKLENNVEIYDIIGRRVYHYKISELPITLNVNDLTEGIYVLALNGIKKRLQIRN